MKRLLELLLLAAAFILGYRLGVGSVEITETMRVDTVYYQKPEPVRVTHTARNVVHPIFLFAPADTIREKPFNQPVDSVELNVDIEWQEYGGRDTTFFAVVSGPALGGLRPQLERLELYTTERSRTSVLRKPYRWEIGPAAGAWYAPAGGGVWLGAGARCNLGRLSIAAAAGYDTRNSGPFGQVQAGLAVWRR